jgi:hypothetical protein
LPAALSTVKPLAISRTCSISADLPSPAGASTSSMRPRSATTSSSHSRTVSSSFSRSSKPVEAALPSPAVMNPSIAPAQTLG